MAVDLERFTDVAGRGCDRLRDSVFENWLGLCVGRLEEFSLGVNICGAEVSVFWATVVLSMAAAMEDERERLGAGLRANMSLMLRRLSISNSGNKRPDPGNIHRDEYSC